METFADRLRRLRKLNGLTLKEVSLRLNGPTHSRYSNWEYGRTEPDIASMKKLAKIFDVSLDYLMVGDEGNTILEKADKPEFVHIPLLGTIRAGEPIERLENIEGTVPIPKNMISSGYDTFALTVQGESMAGDGLHEGDVVICYVTPDVNSNDIAVVAVNGHEATLKRVKKEGDMCILLPSNKNYEPQLISAKDCHIIGKVQLSFRKH